LRGKFSEAFDRRLIMSGVGFGLNVAGQTGARANRSVDNDSIEKQDAFDSALEGAGDSTSKDPECHVLVGSKPIKMFGGAVDHAYVLTQETGQRDPGGPPPYLGRETAHRGGPGPRTREREEDDSPTKITTESREYSADESRDYPKPGEQHSFERVSTHKGTCDEIDKTMEAATKDIEREDHDYELATQNSNSVASEVLERAGEPVPSDPPGLTPGWGTDLPSEP
jgi:hypothetical protein